MSTTTHDDACTCREHPLPDAMSLVAARDAYLAENGFTVAAYEDRWTQASFFGIPIAVPNTRRHQWAIRLHDLHHVATGYGTDLVGEAEISAWELRGGVGALGLYVAGIVASVAALGLVMAPRRLQRARRAATGAPSLFSRTDEYGRLLALSVGELRALLVVPPGGIETGPRKLHPRAP